MSKDGLPIDWPANPYQTEIEKEVSRHKGGLLTVFARSLSNAASGRENRMLTLTLNKQIVDLRDKALVRYLHRKRHEGIDLNTMF